MSKRGRQKQRKTTPPIRSARINENYVWGGHSGRRVGSEGPVKERYALSLQEAKS